VEHPRRTRIEATPTVPLSGGTIDFATALKNVPANVSTPMKGYARAAG
jgi:hypothetical protein